MSSYDDVDVYIELLIAFAPTPAPIASGVDPEENMAHYVLRNLSTAELVAVARDLSAADERGEDLEDVLCTWLEVRGEPEPS
jgi:hypothetical protein